MAVPPGAGRLAAAFRREAYRRLRVAANRPLPRRRAFLPRSRSVPGHRGAKRRPRRLAGGGWRGQAARIMAPPALELIGLRTEFRIRGTWHAAVRDISLRLERDETLALVGESGCGKSVTALSVMGLVQPPMGRVAAGRILLDGQDLAGLPDRELERLRGDRLAMIFQEPMTSLNPVMTVGDQVAEALRIHRASRAPRRWSG